MRKPKILFINNSSGARLWRIDPIHKYLRDTKGWEAKQIRANEFNPIYLDGLDIIVLEMIMDERIFDECQKKKIKIVFEADDMMDYVPKDHYALKQVQDKKFVKMCHRAFREADLVTVTNKRLQDYYKKYRKGEIHILPNYIDLNVWSYPHNPNYSSQLRIGYAGSTSHVDDLKTIAPILNKILAKHKDARFFAIGTGGRPITDPATKAVNPEDLFPSIPEERREFSFGMPPDGWPSYLNSFALDFGLAPVLRNKFTVCKTPIKWMEYAINHVPCVAADFLYKDVIDDGVNGFLAKTSEEWMEKIERLANDKQLRKKMGEIAYEEVIHDYDVGQHLYKWYDLYKTLI